MEEWGECFTVSVTVMVGTTAPINKKQKKVGMKYLAKILWGSSLILLVQCSLAFRFTLLELVKEGYRGAKKGRVGRVECKGLNLTIDFLVDVLRQEGMRRVRMGSFQLLGVLLIYSSLLSHVTPT